ncbi:hypothetical protein [Ferrovibrio sp.]|uniref:hypothetical protein n=1 Tax=Ferrovibrio sp. TaxID=1917215 RepID=UPI0025BF24F3|nr:hypothetical protein [Ferrovibrio sp.]MBX3454208.1 hypothetical protein [Ferrovibrio sp.]
MTDLSMPAAARKQGWLSRGWEFFFPPVIGDGPGFRDFLAGEASYLAQKTVTGFARVKTLLAFEKLMKEDAFRQGMDICRWEAFAQTLADCTIMAEGVLRPADAAQAAKVADGLRRLYADILNEHVPVHRQQEGWADRLEQFNTRFAQSRMAAPLHPAVICKDTAASIMEYMPLHNRLIRNDLEVIAGDLGFHIVALRDGMAKRLQPEPLRAWLAALV